MTIKVKDLIKYLQRFNLEEDLFIWADEIDQYLPFDKDCFGTFAVRKELETAYRKEVKVKYLKRTNKSREKFHKWLKKKGYK